MRLAAANAALAGLGLCEGRGRHMSGIALAVTMHKKAERCDAVTSPGCNAGPGIRSHVGRRSTRAACGRGCRSWIHRSNGATVQQRGAASARGGGTVLAVGVRKTSAAWEMSMSLPMYVKYPFCQLPMRCLVASIIGSLSSNQEAGRCRHAAEGDLHS